MEEVRGEEAAEKKEGRKDRRRIRNNNESGSGSRSRRLQVREEAV